MKMISWNVNGLRASLKGGFMDVFKKIDADIFCLQETKMEQGQAELDLTGYQEYWNSATRKGYSGTAVFTKKAPMIVTFGIDIEKHDQEGRVITLEFEDYYFVNVYTPNSQRELVRLGYRMEWEDNLRSYLLSLDTQKPVILCGDLNVAHQEIDIKNAKSNHKNAGFTDQEREKMTLLLNSGFSDTFRTMHPDDHEVYSWWSQMPGVRERNVGWRIDYFLVSRRMMPQIKEAFILSQVYGSDHCPVGIVV
jgi:exodeoxyribonuclease-3